MSAPFSLVARAGLVVVYGQSVLFCAIVLALRMAHAVKIA